MRQFPRAIALAVSWLAATAMAVMAHAQISAATLTQANQDLQAGEVDKALALLTPLPQTGQGADQAQNLICRVQITLAVWSQAVTSCQAATRLTPNSSDFHMWLARALGGKAGAASFLTAYSLAKQTLSEFQEAVKLGPANVGALSDLGDFYRQAPGIVGGGTDKATAIATQLAKVSPARADQLNGNIAATKKDYATAENDLKQAIAADPHPAEAWVNLAQFYAAQKRWTDLDNAINSSVSVAAHDQQSGVALYDGAGLLISTNRNPTLAAQMLENYLASSSKTEEGPAFIAYIRLGNLKQKLGDAAGAQAALATAAAMAHEYNQAQASH